jgi:uncharacterized protein YdhG (YjbR/CyaY superfamily)
MSIQEIHFISVFSLVVYNSDMDKAIKNYITSFPEDTQKILKTLYSEIKKIIPDSGEKISYGIPTFTMHGTYVVYFAGFKKHISVFPATEELPSSLKKLLDYKTGKGTFQFPLDKPLPMPLIKKFVEFRLKNVKEKASKKKK